MESWDSHIMLPDWLGSSSKNSWVLGGLRASPTFLTNDGILTSNLPVNAGHAPVDLGFRDANGRVGTVTPTVAAANGSLLPEEGSTLKFSGSLVVQSSMIDLKLGSLAEQRDGISSRLTREAPMLSLSESSNPTPLKRYRASGPINQVVHCQVYGCNKDLTSSKEYYKRHRVCEVHSKTAKVIVSEMEQRFCQQCSRFHLLGEFDDGKRSCRKRLAGHNERRRKPKHGLYSSGRGFLLPCNADKLGGTNDWISHIKPEARTNQGTGILSLSSIHYRDVHARRPVSSPSYDEKETSSFEEISHITWYTSLLDKDQTLGSEEFATIFNREASILGLPGISESICARSLLSPLSHNSYSIAYGVPDGHSLSQHGTNQDSDNRVLCGASRRFINPEKEGQAAHPVAWDGDSASFEISKDVLQKWQFSNTNGLLSGKEA